MLPEKKKPSADFALFSSSSLLTGFIMHLIPQTSPPWSSNLLHRTLQGAEKRETTTGGMAMGQPDQEHIYNLLSPFSVITEGTLFFSCPPPPSSSTTTSPSLTSVREDQVGKVRLQPVAGNHLAEFWRAIVWELKVGAQAALAERVQVLIHKRQGEVS